MARETIDLLSSSPQPLSAAQKPQTISSTASTSSAVPPRTTQSPQELTKSAPANQAIEIISDYDELPTQSVFKSNGSGLSKNRITDIFGLPPLSSDDDPYGLPVLTNKPAIANLPANNLKRDRDFFYLSDDFDTTIDLDKSVNDVRDLPAPKRTAVEEKSAAGAVKRKIGGYQRSSSNIETSTSTYGIIKLKKTRSVSGGVSVDKDPILFTSSPDPYKDAARKRAAKANIDSRLSKATLYPLAELSSDTDLPSDIGTAPMRMPKVKPLTTQFDKFLADRKKEKEKDAKTAEKDQKLSQATEEKASKADAKAAEKAVKQAAKEERDREKKEKAREKERAGELAKVNTLRTNKNVSCQEMIVELPTSLDTKLRIQTEAHLEASKIEIKQFESQMPVIKFRRKVDAEWNEEKDQYEPVERYVKKEKHIIYIMKAHEFVELCRKDEAHNIDVFILQLKAKFEGHEIIMLMEGYNTFIRKNRNIKVRQFTNNVRAIGAPPGEVAPTASQRRKKKESEYVDEDLIEDAMLRLQMIHELLVHHTAVIQETAEQITTFTQHISLIPYKSLRTSNTSAFCMESGQVKTGDGPIDTYVKMLQEIVRITAPIAYGIQAKYPTVRSLIEGCLKEGPTVVEECRKSANKDGAFTDRRVGPAISKRVWKVFTGRDVNSLDV